MSKAFPSWPRSLDPLAQQTEHGSDEAHRQLFLSHGATNSEAEELLAYARTGFDTRSAAADADDFPLADEPFVTAWEQYANEAGRRSANEVLRERLVQLRFPVAA